MEILQVNPEEVVSAQQISQNDKFIVSNTQAINYDELRTHCIIPVFAKDNECTISHSDFIDIVGNVSHRFFSGERISPPTIRISHPIKGRTPEAMGKPVDQLSALNDYSLTEQQFALLIGRSRLYKSTLLLIEISTRSPSTVILM